jgi:hypothetical protein
MRHTSSGEATWWPKSATGLITVRGEITDTAGNPAVTQATVKLSEKNLSHDDSGAEAARWPADRAPADAAGKGPAADTGRKNDRDWRGSPGSEAGGDAVPRLAAQPVGQTTRDKAQPSPLDFSLLPPGERPRMVGSRSFELEYEIDAVGPSGVGRVELWGTLDGGRSWSVYGVDSDNRSPVSLRVEREGIYGFRIVVQSGSGLGGQPPASGDPADVWIGVDLEKPSGRIGAVEPSDDGTELVITWEASDDLLDVRPISLRFAEAAGGPWTPIASGLENSGSYTWRLDGRVPPKIYLRLEVRDEAGNLGVFDSGEPISLDRSRPEGRIRGVRPVN